MRDRGAAWSRLAGVAAVAALAAWVGLAGAGCGDDEQQGWEVRRYSTGDPSLKAVERELVGPCRVTHVADGDTLDVECTRLSDQVRLLRIDTPEAGQRGHAEARNALVELVQGKDVYLLFEEKGVRDRGNYGRLLAYAYVDGKNVNIEMVRRGWSTFWTDFGEGRFADAFRAAEEQARKKGAGLWAKGGPS